MREKHIDDAFEFIDMQVIPNTYMFDSTLVGGLSSIDFIDEEHCFIIADDRSEFNDARFYKAKIEYSSKGIDTIFFKEVNFIYNQSGKPYKLDEIDPEAIRYFKQNNSILISSEGGRVGDFFTRPFIHQLSLQGDFLKSYKLPEVLVYDDTIGLRNNGGLESLSFENDSIIWFANEVALKQDGTKTALDSTDSPIRLYRYDLNNQKVLQAYKYPLDPVFLEPKGEDPFFINSLPELLVVDSTNILMLERAYADGAGNDIRLYHVQIDSERAFPSGMRSISKGVRSLEKREVLNFSNFENKPDNIEGIAFGKQFTQEKISLFLISDNNFNDQQQTQLWLFSVNLNDLLPGQ